MKWIDPSFEVLEQKDGVEGMYEQIETAGRTCYKSVGTSYFIVPVSREDNSFFNRIMKAIHDEEDIEDIESSGCSGLYSTCIVGSKTLYLSLSQQTIKSLGKELTQELEPYRVEKPVDVYHDNVTAVPFVEGVLKPSGHWAMLEFGTVYLKTPLWRLDVLFSYLFNKYSRLNLRKWHYNITTNYRVLCEKRRERDLFLFEKTEYHYSRPCVRFVMDRVGSQSVERHRGKYGISFAQESTRFCNYGSKKFKSEIIYIIPRWMYKLRDRLSECVDSLTGVSQEWMKELEGEKMVNVLSCKDRSAAAYVEHCENAENDYMFLTSSEESEKLNPQDARGILPLCVKTEFCMCAFMVDWKHFFELRDESHAHPDIQYIAHNLHNTFPFSII